jgi:hypothetical protein
VVVGSLLVKELFKNRTLFLSTIIPLCVIP